MSSSTTYLNFNNLINYLLVTGFLSTFLCKSELPLFESKNLHEWPETSLSNLKLPWVSLSFFKTLKNWWTSRKTENFLKKHLNIKNQFFWTNIETRLTKSHCRSRKFFIFKNFPEKPKLPELKKSKFPEIFYTFKVPWVFLVCGNPGKRYKKNKSS